MLSPMNGDTPLFESEPEPPLTPPSEQQPALTPADVPPVERFGEAIYEDILTLQVARNRPANALSIGRAMGYQILSEARSTAKLDVRADIDDALSRVEIAMASPILGEMLEAPRQGRPRRGRNSVRVSQAQEVPQDGEGPRSLRCRGSEQDDHWMREG
jgi:hypothetical protein